MPSNASWDQYARMLARWAPAAEHEQVAYFRLLESIARPGIAWLDAGCGHTLVPGWLRGGAELERRLVALGRPLVGCDIDPPSLATSSPIQRVACDLEQLCFRPAAFDLITCNVVVEHIADPPRAFRMFYQALKPGGRLIINTPNLRHWSNMVARITPHWFHRRVMGKLAGMVPEDVFPTRYRANTPAQLTRALESAGFAQPAVRCVMGRPRLVGMGPLLWLEFQLYRLWRRFPSRGEFLCAVATKPAAGRTGA